MTWPLALLLLAGCGARSTRVVGTDGDTDTDTDTGTGTGTGSGTGTGTHTDTDTGSGTDTNTDTETFTETGTETGWLWPCNPFTDERCEAEEKCGIRYSVAPVELQCVVNGGHAAGERCSVGARPGYDGAFDNCDSGLACFALEGDGGLRRCHATCPCDEETGCHSDGCGETEYCSNIVDPHDQPDFPLGVCVPTTPCNPLDQTSCPERENCYVILAADRPLSDCAAWRELEGSEGLHGDPCDYVNNCQRGFQCEPESVEDRVCRRICDPEGGSPTCEAGEGVCDALEGYESIGLCNG